MKRIESNQMELLVGGSNPFWTGVGCGLMVGGGAILGALTPMPLLGAIAGAAAGVGNCLQK